MVSIRKFVFQRGSIKLLISIKVEDKLQTACFGRPSTVGTSEFDLRPLKLTDFDCENSQAELFVEYVKLNIILGRILDSHSRKSDFAYSEVGDRPIKLNQMER